MLHKFKPGICTTYILTILLVLGMAKLAQSQKSNFFTSSYTSQETGASLTNFGIEQAPDGKFLFTNRNGLLIFDGKNWKLHQTKDDQGVNIIFLKTYAISDKKIYTGGVNDIGYWRVHRDTYQYTSLLKKDQRKNNVITQIIKFEKYIFFVAQQKIFITDGNRLIKTIEANRAKSFAYLFIIQEKLYLSRFGSIEIWDESKQDFVTRFKHQTPSTNGSRGALTMWLSQYKNNLLGLFFQQGLWTISDKESKKIQFPRAAEAIFKQGVYFVRVLDKQTLIFSTAKNLYLLNLSQRTIKKLYEGNSFIRHIYLDQRKNIWLTNNEYIAQIETSSPFRYYLPKLGVRKMLAQQDGVFLGGVGTQQNIQWIKPDKKIIPIDFDLPAIRLCGASSGKLLAGDTRQIFLVDYVNNTKKLIFNSRGICEIYKDSLNFIYISFRGKIKVMRLVNDQLEEVGEMKHQGTEIALSILRRGNELWMGFNQAGVMCYTLDAEKFPTVLSKETFSTEKGYFTGDDALSNVQIWEDKVLINNFSGIYEFQDKSRKLSKLKIKGLKPNDNTYRVTFTKNKIFSTGQNNKFTSLGVAKKTPKGYIWYEKPFLRLPSLEMRELMVHHNKLYVATSKGLFIFDPQKEKDYNFHYPIQINAVLDTHQIAGDTVLAYNSGQFTFHYSISFFEAPEKLEYAYKLLGFHNKWSAWSTETKKEYTNLQEGNYTLLVKAKNVYGTVSKESSFQFTISPPWYRTGWAYAVYVIAGLLFVWVVIRINGYRLHKQKQRLEAEVARQTHEIIVQKEEIAQQAEELKTSNEKLAELSNFRESLSHMLVHDAKQPLTSLINFDHMQVRRAAQQVLSMLDNILEVQKFESNEVVLQPKHITIGDLISLAIHQIRDLADEKLINIKNTIPLQLIIEVDAGYILRVFTNLLGNAIKYSPANSSIRFEAEEMTAQQQLKIWIKDNGPGIPDEHKHSIFDKFGRIDRKDQRSTGLGLAFCKLAVKAHEGEIGVLTISETQALNESGAWFYFTVPLVLGDLPSTKNDQSLISQEFTTQDQELIKGFIPQLREIDFYDAGKIMILLQNRDWVGSPALEAWIERIPFTDDETHYQQMLRMFE
ncbi:MAG TPA: hypothetical protein DCS93_05230 [Microscillaceae bacterium]|nr:hypothetical protein [Microscillaceae bacterium]